MVKQYKCNAGDMYERPTETPYDEISGHESVVIVVKESDYAALQSQLTEAEEIVKRAARLNCHCQKTAHDVDINKHVESCLVGQAQSLLSTEHDEETAND